MQHLAAQTERIISPQELSKLTGLSQATIWRLRFRGEFPNPIRLSPGRVGYRSVDIEAWIEGRSAAAAGSGDE
jgi:prophage regulatory protein